MKIKDAAEKYGISAQAIYQRLKKQNIPIDSLKDTETGDLTPDALGILENLFGESSAQYNQQKASLHDELARLKQLVQSLEYERDILKVKLEAAERERDTANETLNQERAMFTKFLPAPDQQRQGFISRIFGKKK